MQQIADWLKKLGMSEYAQRFAENRVDFSVLPDLTDHDLEKLGVVLGDRRKMLRAIANLEATEKSTPAVTVAASTSAAPVTPHDTAERRQVTVMPNPPVGSTALSARLDPEDLREFIVGIRSAWRRPCAFAGSWRSTWAMGCSFIWVIRKLTKTMPSEPCVQGWSWSLR